MRLRSPDLRSLRLPCVAVTTLMMIVLTIGFTVLAQDNPLNSLPSNIEVLTHFGERAVWSPAGDRIAFVHRTLGDAFEITLDTREIRCLTCQVEHSGFFRFHYLSTGDFILIGPPRQDDRNRVRWNESEVWFMSKETPDRLVRLGQRLNEGIAASRLAPRIAWSESSNQSPDTIPEGVSRLYVAEIEVQQREARLVNKRQVHEDKWPRCWLEAQDFRAADSELIFSCYQPDNESEVMGVRLKDGLVTNYTKSPKVYDEPEGIFPDGEHTTVECDLQNDKGDHYIDIWKLRLDGRGDNYSRLTFFSDYPGYKASNPAVSPDGRQMAFQLAKSKDEAGVGYGILLYTFVSD